MHGSSAQALKTLKAGTISPGLRSLIFHRCARIGVGQASPAQPAPLGHENKFSCRSLSSADRTYDPCLMDGSEDSKERSYALCAGGRNRTFDLCLIRTAFYH